MNLKISSDLSLPLDTVTQTLVTYGGKGMGKTNFAAILAEELYRCHLRFSVLDPVGVSWGLQHGADKTKPGLQILVLGGIHGDLPIEPTGGAVVADLVADETVSTVIDISRRADGRMWGMGEKIRFVTDYCTRLYERQGEKRIPVMQIIDEAGRFCPQQIPSGAIDIAKCVGAIEQMCELGRNVGIGMTLITQRSARMNKSVSELAECMIAFRIIGPHSLAAVTDWLGAHVDREKVKAVVEQVRALPRGHAFMISPGWLDFEGVIAIRARTTFDSSATPKPGQSIRAPGKAAKPDLDKYRERMAETIEKAQASDPNLLKRKIGELEAKLKQPAAKAAAEKIEVVKETRVEIPVLKDIQLKRLEITLQGFEKASEKMVEAFQSIATEIRRIKAIPPPQILVPARPALAQRLIQKRPVEIPLPKSNGEPSILGKGEKTILRTVAQYPQGATREQITVMTGYKRSSRDTYLQRLLQAGQVQVSGDGLTATQAGMDALGSDFEPLPTGEALRAYWLGKLGGGEREILRVLMEVYPQAMERDKLSELTTYQRSSRDTYLQRLCARQIVKTEGRGAVKASEILFA